MRVRDLLERLASEDPDAELYVLPAFDMRQRTAMPAAVRQVSHLHFRDQRANVVLTFDQERPTE